MRIVILTSSSTGSPVLHLNRLLQCSQNYSISVIYCENQGQKIWRKIVIKLKKVLKIGIFGAVNGMRIRSWYNIDSGGKNIFQICHENGIQIFTTPKLNSTTTQVLMKELHAELGISLGNGYIGKKIFSIPVLGMINIHHELLPQYRNAQSIIWQLYNMSLTTGFTIHKITDQIDAGEILYQEKVPIDFKRTLRETVLFNYNKLNELSAIALCNLLSNNLVDFKSATPQGASNSYTTPSLRQFIKIYRNFKLLKNKKAE
jgi:methionyl-tRNA formyltransferase